jgi:hypothetical protein
MHYCIHKNPLYKTSKNLYLDIDFVEMKNTLDKEKGNVPFIYDLVDIAILPAALLICAKVIGIWGLNSLLGLNWGVQTVSDSFFTLALTYDRLEDVTLIISYSNLFMFITVIAGCMLVTSKSLLFNHRKASPYFVLKLAKYDLLHLLKSSLHVYKEAFVWGFFLIVTTVYILISFITGQTYGWVAGLSLVFCLTYLWITIETIEQEILFHNYK